MRIVAIVGSPRVNGNTSYLTDQALEEARKLGVEVEKIILTQYQINPCQGCDECQYLASCIHEDDTVLILRKLYEADGIILTSPVYYRNVTAQMKAFIDRSVYYWRRQRRMKARCAATIVVARTVGIEEATNVLIRFITSSSNVVAEQVLQMHGFAGTEGEIRKNKAIVEQARKLGKNIAEELAQGF